MINLNVFGAEGGEEPEVRARQSGDTLDIDLIFKEVEGRIGAATSRKGAGSPR